MNRRQLLALLAARPLVAARSRIGKNKVSAVTDEIGASQSEAIAFAQRFTLVWVELRKVPGTKNDFSALPFPEVKRYAAELGQSKLKVSVLHAGSVTPEVLETARNLGAAKLLTPAGIVLVASPEAAAGIDWDPGKSPEMPAKSRLMNVRIPALMEMNWRRVLEGLERENYQGQICLETPLDKAEDAMRELMHFIGEL